MDTKMTLLIRSSVAIILTIYFINGCTAFVTTKPNDSNENNNARLGKTSSNTGIAYLTNKRYQRSIYGLGPKMLAISHSKIPIELDLLVDDIDNDSDGRAKRYDDYGHMRFGKRGGGKFDDYGHMRFGRNV